MPFSYAASARHLAAAITHGGPVSVRTSPKAGPAGEPFAADFASTSGALGVVDGGLIYDRGGTLVVSKTVLPDGVIEDTFLEMLLPGNIWKRYKVENVSGAENPMYPEVKLVIVPPGK